MGYYVTVDSQKCTGCKEELPATDFDLKLRSKTGLQNMCRKCLRELNSNIYYGERERMIEDEGGCGICGESGVHGFRVVNTGAKLEYGWPPTAYVCKRCRTLRAEIMLHYRRPWVVFRGLQLVIDEDEGLLDSSLPELITLIKKLYKEEQALSQSGDQTTRDPRTMTYIKS